MGEGIGHGLHCHRRIAAYFEFAVLKLHGGVAQMRHRVK
jgi:hypothetical protein